MSLTNDEYDERRRFLEDLKGLTKTEHEKMLIILRNWNAEFSENSNGVFFDISKTPKEVFQDLQKYMTYCKTIRKEQAEREKEMDELR